VSVLQHLECCLTRCEVLCFWLFDNKKCHYESLVDIAYLRFSNVIRADVKTIWAVSRLEIRRVGIKSGLCSDWSRYDSPRRISIPIPFHTH
jgi:hypothetical protein